MPETITINGIHLWIGVKVIIAILLMRWECKYPMWDTNGNERSRSLIELGRIAFFHFVLNPEWTVLKTLALLPVSLIKGKNLLTRPIKISGKPAVCKLCDDTGFMKMHDITLSLIPCSCPIGIKYKKQTWPAMRWECPNCHETSFPKNC